MRHILRSQQFDRANLERFFDEVTAVEKYFIDANKRRQLSETLKSRVMCTLFYEPSTRTRVSFEMAAHRLGMAVITTENAAEFSSAIKGETLEDSIRVIAGYGADVIVLRHKEDGASDRASSVVDCSGLLTHIINAGDGRGQHPTQALLDIYTIFQMVPNKVIDGLNVVIGGDLANGRTVRSIVYHLAHFKPKISFVSPSELTIGDDIKAHLREHDIEFQETSMLGKVLPEADVVYWTRVQRERMTDPNLQLRNFSDFSIGIKEMEKLKPSAIVMHPLPRIDEISKEVDDDERAVYFKQARNGLFVRIALLMRLFKIEKCL
jgi:aspartate carbamoyltransferase catalytic subunit